MFDITELDFKTLTRKRKVNGEKTINLDVLPTDRNKSYYESIVEEAEIYFDGDTYIIKKLNERSIGTTYHKQIESFHDFYVNLINKQQPLIHNGSITFNNYMQMVFEDTGYTFVVIGSFPARSFENLGNDNRLSLLQKGLDRFQVEFELVGNQVRFKDQVGNDTDFQFRFGHNIRAISREVDTTNLTTLIRGKWEDGMELEYISPNAAIFGEQEVSKTFDDERYTTRESRLEEMESRIQDTPEVSITIDFADLRAAGYPYTVPNEGDRVWVIYEPMDDLLIETRILEINEEFDVNLNPIKTTVNLANYKKTFAGTMFNNVQKQLSNIVNEDGIVKYSVLDEAFRLATEALKSAQTELNFENGIIARDKDNPNNLVLFNSAGLGISLDGGMTFEEAITYLGINTKLLTAGDIHTNNIRIIGTDDYFYWDGTGLHAVNPSDVRKYVRLRSDGLYIAKGAMTIEREDGFKVVDNGMLTGDFAIQGSNPPFRDFTDVTIRGQWLDVSSLQRRRFDRYTFSHMGRYLRIDLSRYVAQGGGAQGVIYAEDSATGDELWSISFDNNEQHDSAQFLQSYNIDLGIPTGRPKSIIIRLRTTVASYPASLHIGRISIWG